MKSYTTVIEYCKDTNMYVGFIPGFTGAHSQAETIDELKKNLEKVVEMLLEDGEPVLESRFIGTQTIEIL
jgi:predicted RNase H-like HicB family nuclease